MMSFFALIAGVLFGQTKITEDPKQRALIKDEFLSSLHRELKTAFQKIETADLPIPYFVGDEFILTKPLKIAEIMNPDSSISFDIDKGALIPDGYVLKLIRKKGSIYFIQTRDSNRKNDRTDIISEKILKSYFFPNYEKNSAQFFDEYKETMDALTKHISRKYNLTVDETIEMIDSFTRR